MRGIPALGSSSCRSLLIILTLAAIPIAALRSSIVSAQCSQDRIPGPAGSVSARAGAAVAISGAVAAIGIPGADGAGADAGGVAILREAAADGAWVVEALQLPAGIAPGDAFGSSVAVSGGIAAIGAPGNDAVAPGAGNVRLLQYAPSMGVWEPAQTLSASDAQTGDEYGHAVALRGDTILIGAWQEDSGGAEAGAAYIHRVDPVTGFWLEEQKIVPADLAPGDRFGASVALEVGVAVIGAVGPGFGAGALYVYRYDPLTEAWAFEQKILPADLAILDQFAHSVSTSGERILAGAWRDDDQGPDSGSAYVFARDPGTGLWSQEAKLVAPDGASGDRFGFAVSLSGDLAIVGASGDDPEGAASGSAYLFARDPVGGWAFVEKLADEPEGLPGDRFGEAVAISGARAIAGAPEHDGTLPDTGAARLFIVGGEDCNGSGEPDLCDLLAGTSADLNGNGVPDECDFVAPVADLVCMRVGDDVEIAWTNPEAYDNVLVSIDGLPPLQLPGVSTSTLVVALGLGFHAFEVTAVTNQVLSAGSSCVVALAPAAVSGLSCSAGDPCALEALLSWGPVDPGATSIEIELAGLPTASVPASESGTAATVPGAGTWQFCVATRVDDIDPDTGELVAILSAPVCCTVTVVDVPEVPVSGLVCSVDLLACTAELAWSIESQYSQIALTIGGETALILDGTSESATIPLPGTERYEVCLVATTICGVSTPPVCCEVSCGADFRRGDANADGYFDIGDPIKVLSYLFSGGSMSCVSAADANADSLVDVSDVIQVLDTLFSQGPPLPHPYPGCGNAASPLGCESFAACP